MRHLILALGLLGATGLAATAQDMPPVDDADGDGFYSLTELQATFPDLTEEIYGTLDTSGDGNVDMTEVAAAVAAGTLSPQG